jgi:hypothetical protein
MLLLGATFSLILILLFPEHYLSRTDMNSLINWAQNWNEDWTDIYVTCKECNYPFVGIFSYAGMASILGIVDDFQHGAFNYRLFLAVIDGLNVLLLYALFKAFQVKNGGLWAGIIGILPSSWAGGAFWAQIDDVGQFFILLSLLWIVWNHRGYCVFRKKYYWLYIAVAGLFLSFAVLTKQLLLFSVFSVSLFLFIDILIYSRRWQQVFAYTSVAFGVFLIFNLFVDSLLSLEDPYFSHLLYIWNTGSGHINQIGNGFNIWLFSGGDMWRSSNDPFFWILTPKNTGIFLFMGYLSVITFSLLRQMRKVFTSKSVLFEEKDLLLWVFYLALVNLGFNILLSGTHERYLYHFYPFAFLAVLGLHCYNAEFSNRKITIYSLLTGAVLYGEFVIIRQYHIVVGVIHIFLLIYLSFLFMKQILATVSPEKEA